jgi:hypothetical protein
VLLVALCRALDAMKQPAAKVSVMEFLVLYLGEGKAAGPASNPLHLRQWLARNLPLLIDKTGIVRQIALRALHCIAAMDIDTVYAAAAAAPPPESAAVQRALKDMMRAHRHAQEEADTADLAEEEEAMAQVLLVDHSQPPAAAGMDVLHPSSYAMAHDAEMYHQHHQQQQQAAAASLQLAETIASMHLGAQPAPSTQQQPAAAAAGYSHAGAAGLPVQEEGRTLYPLLTHPSGSAALTGQQQQQQQQVVAGPAPSNGSSGWGHGDQSQPFQHLQAPRVGQAAAVAAAPAAGYASHSSSDVGSGRPAAAAAVAPAAGYLQPAAAPATPGAAAAAAPSVAASSSAAATPPGALVPTSVLGRPFMASPALMTINLEQLRATLPQDPAAQARHLTLLVHRLSSRPATGVLEELVACAQVLGAQAWQANFAKVGGLGCSGRLGRYFLPRSSVGSFRRHMCCATQCMLLSTPD